MFYDVKFGRKKESEKQDAAEGSREAVSNGNSSNGTANGGGHVKNTSDLAIYEQYRTQVVSILFLGAMVRFYRYLIGHFTCLILFDFRNDVRPTAMGFCQMDMMRNRMIHHSSPEIVGCFIMLLLILLGQDNPYICNPTSLVLNCM